MWQVDEHGATGTVTRGVLARYEPQGVGERGGVEKTLDIPSSSETE
jgi:hypothetical protein